MVSLRKPLAVVAGLLAAFSALTLPVSPVSASAVPSAPTVTLGAATVSSVRVAWTAPASNGSPITRFELRRGATLVSASISSTSTSYNNTGLSSGTEYSFTLKACSALGCSDASTALTAATLPVAPTLVTGAAGVGEVSVSWVNSTSSVVTGHKVFYKTSSALTWSEWTPGESDTSPTVVTGLTNAVPYVFKVAAYNDSGSTESRPTANIIPRTVPNAPTITLSTAGTTGITFTWAAPATNGAAITSYKVYKDGVLASTLGTSTRFTANGLTAGTEYAFTVQACNVAGCSVDSNTLTVPTKPASTTLILGTPGNTQISVNWTASVSPVVTGYNLFFKTSSALTWTEWTPGELDTSPVTVTGLTNGTAYVFKVASVNASGNTESRSSSAVTPRTTPSAPVLIPGTATFATLAYTWAEPSNGGNKITGYQVYVNNSLHSTVTSGRLTLSGLTAATEYDVKVRACNGAGCGAFSSVHEAVTKATAVTVTVTPADSSAALTWTNASGVVDAHKVYYKLATSAIWTEWTPGESDTSPTTVTGLTNGVSYNFKVAAVNNAGATDSSSVSKTPLGVPPVAPAQPTASTVTASGATIAWSAPSNTGGISANGYQIWVNGLLVSTTTASARSYVITGQTPAETHSAQVKVCNTAGCSPASTARSFNTLPVAATSLAVDPSSLTASVSWTNSSGSLVSAHNLYYKAASASTWTEWTPGVADGSPVTVTGLSAGTQYNFKVQTVASSGSVETASVNATTLSVLTTAPSAPTDVIATGGDSQVSLVWKAPEDDGGSAITDYQIEYNTGSGWIAYADGTSTNEWATVTGLTNGTEYTFRISAVNSVGTGTASSTDLSSVATPAAAGGGALTLDYTQTGLSPSVATLSPSVSGGTGSYTFSYSGTLPSSVSFDTETGTFSGPASWDSYGTAIAAGHTHACAITGSGSLNCWGSNTYGELGTGLTETASKCVYTADGSVQEGYSQYYCNSYASQFTWTTGTFNASALTPTPVAGLSSGVTAVAVGGTHTCAIVNGAAMCWGANGSGQLGDGTFTSSTTPVQVTGLTSGVTAIDAYGSATCAVHNGAAKCWGQNSGGQIGNGSTPGWSAKFETPTQVTGLTSGVVSIAVGNEHACALLADGTLNCWGKNNSGQLGSGETTTGQTCVTSWGTYAYMVPYCGMYGGTVVDVTVGLDTTTPVAVSGILSATQIVAGSSHTCALLSTGAVKCWGGDSEGQVGDGTVTADGHMTPVSVSGLGSSVTEISAGEQHTCAVHQGQLKCWGNNWSGQLGNGSTNSYLDASNNYATAYMKYPTPLVVTELGTSVQRVSAGGGLTCALSSGAAHCWGRNDSGQTGTGITGKTLIAENVSGLGATATQVVSGADFSCALLTTGAVKCWGANGSGQLGAGFTGTFSATPLQVQGLTSGVTKISAAGDRACAVHTGALKCWGFTGEVDGVYTKSIVPVQISGLSSGVVDVAVAGKMGLPSSASACALLSDATVKCWGSNNHGQLGDGTTTDSTTPVAVQGIDPVNVRAASVHQAGLGMYCMIAASGAVSTAGALYCWGDSNGKVSFPSMGDMHGFVTATLTSLTSGVTAISGFTYQSLCVQQNGTTGCSGVNQYGHLGTTIVGDGSLTPVAPNGLGSTIASSVGESSACAVTTSGALYCWGADSWGQSSGVLGFESVSVKNFPTAAASVTDASAVALGSKHGCVLRTDGNVACWGASSSGQTGRVGHTLLSAAVPTSVTGLTGYPFTVTVTVTSGSSSVSKDVTISLG
jgi:alpha-tubulin suppressor-like RCC1 family protein